MGAGAHRVRREQAGEGGQELGVSFALGVSGEKSGVERDRLGMALNPKLGQLLGGLDGSAAAVLLRRW